MIWDLMKVFLNFKRDRGLLGIFRVVCFVSKSRPVSGYFLEYECVLEWIWMSFSDFDCRYLNPSPVQTVRDSFYGIITTYITHNWLLAQRLQHSMWDVTIRYMLRSLSGSASQKAKHIKWMWSAKAVNFEDLRPNFSFKWAQVFWASTRIR